MADKKISDLTAATTPLAGTEVLPIVQSGTTKKVSVANFTAGRSIAGSAATFSGTTPSVLLTDSSATRRSAIGFDSLGGSWSLDVGNDVYFKSAAIGSNPTDGCFLYLSRLLGPLVLGTNAASRLSIDSAGDTSILTGDLKISTAGKAINFAGNGGAVWRCGAGTPEGVVTAPVGSLYTRTDGGAGTTLYVKESGAGNTGWVAK